MNVSSGLIVVGV